ncbi:MAG: LysE family transporter [Bacteroidetes bacterium]|nr:LysE family transporter [Bacteroidota bacterium]
MQYIFTALLGILVGILITVPLGPTSIYVAQRTMRKETRKGLLVAAGAVLVDMFYCLVITMGLIALVYPYMQNAVVQIVFSVFLIGYGVKMLFFEKRVRSGEDENGGEHDETDEIGYETDEIGQVVASSVVAGDVDASIEAELLPLQPDGKGERLPWHRQLMRKSHYGGVLLGISMTLANPTLFFSWVAVLSFIAAHGLLAPGTMHKLLFSGAVGVGSMGWFFSLALFVRSRRHIISDKFIKTASSITALVIIGFGVYFTITIFLHLNGAT